MKALLVIDIQKPYISKYETDIVQKINERIIEAQKHLYDIVYIKNTKKLRSGTVTDEFADELFLVSILLSCVGVSNLPRFEKTKENLEK